MVLDGVNLKLVKSVSLFIASLMLSACGGIKTVDSVFPATADVCASAASQNRFIVNWEDGRVTLENGTSPDDFRQGFVSKNLNLIKHVDQDRRIRFIQPQSELEVNSTDDVRSQSMNWGPQQIDAPAVWASGIEGAGVIVGVVDGMVDTSHSQLAQNILVNPGEIPNNGKDDDGNGFVDDVRGIQVNTDQNDPIENRHGSHVAGIIVANPNQGPVQGVAPKAKVVPAQFISNNGDGSIGDAIIALNYVASRGAKIINMSWGLNPCVEVPSLRSTLASLNAKGILLITAAGNGDVYGVGVNMDVKPAFPSAYNFSNQLNVAASTVNKVLIGWSNYGSKNVHVAAPGVGIFSTIPLNQVETMSGTSMAAPIVAGAAALLWSAMPNATASQIKQALVKSVERPPNLLEVSSGGIINVYDALQSLKTTAPVP
jgi:subtilisin family serine protease